MVKIEVNDKFYYVKVAKTEEEREVGLQNIEELPKSEGMLFVFDEPQEVSFWMKDTLIPLDIIFIDEYGEVISVAKGEPESEEAHVESNVLYVLEVNAGSKIKAGDDVEIPEDEITDEEAEPVMKVLDEEGESQMDLFGGERIFSRKNTRTLVRLAKKAFDSKLEKDYKALGRKVFKYLEVQDNKEEDYVELPE